MEQVAAFFEKLQLLGVEVLDITPSHGFWGSCLRVHQPSLQVAIVTPANLLAYTPGSLHAARAVQAHLIEVLCAIGRERCDYYLLNGAPLLDEAQLSGALEALELARQEGQIGALGLAAYGDPLRTLALWRTHDAFELVLLPDQPAVLQTLLPEARARRVGVLVEALELALAQAPDKYEALLRARGADAVLLKGTIPVE